MRWLAYRFWRLRGWTFVGVVPDIPKMVIIGAPHTSNWDFVLFLAALHQYKIKVSYIAKHSLFRWPFGYFFRALGGIPVNRTMPGGAVHQVASTFNRSDEMILVMAPEGTRGAAPHWKSGFWKIAQAANVPVVVAGVDRLTRQVSIGPTVDSRQSVGSFMEVIRDFFANKQGIKTGLKGPVQLHEEQLPAL